MDDPQPNTQYSLSSAEFTTIGQSDCMDASDAKIMIERDGSNVVYIDWITFETYSGIWYRIDGYCADFQPEIDYYLDPSYGYTDWIQEESGCPLGYSHVYFCVDNDVSSNGCAPAKQIWHFDVSSPNEYIFDSVWEDGTAVVPQIISCNPSNQPIPSPTNHPSKRPTTPSPTHHPSNRPSASSTNPSNGPTDSPSYDPSKGPTASPSEPTPSPTQPTSPPTQNQIHAVDSQTQPPTQRMADTTNINHGSTSTDNADRDSAAHDTEKTDYPYILTWIGVICALCVGACVLCFMIRKFYGQLKDVQQDIDNVAKTKDADKRMPCEEMNPNANIVNIEAEIVHVEDIDHVNPKTSTTNPKTNDLMNVSNVLEGSVVDEDEEMDDEEDSIDSLYVNKHATNSYELRTAGEVEMGTVKQTN
eukprot:820024_1